MSAEDEFLNPGQVHVHKKPSIPRFYTEPVEMTFKSSQAGRPIFEDREMVEIIIPGDIRSKATEIVNDGHKERWPKEYAAFKRGEEAPLEGTPLRDWPPLTAGRVRELAHFNILTVEQLAEVGDNHLQNLGMGARELREKAKKFLEVARTGTGPLLRLMERADRAEEKVALLESQLAAANVRIRELEGETHARSAA